MSSSPSAVPERTDDERLAALRLAAQVRTRRGNDKVALKERRLDARSIVRHPPKHWHSAFIAELLLAVPSIGHGKVERLLDSAGVPASRTLVGLSDQHRDALVVELNYFYLPDRSTKKNAKRRERRAAARATRGRL